MTLPDAQTLTALAIVAAAGAVLVRRGIQVMRGDKGCGSGCGSCPGGTSQAKPEVNGFVSLDDLRGPRRQRP
ncbi:MAG: FeoB-associated Cys-rich membrane protein [Planctomycetaceae bacterium]|nr:FeoB-associated Cys-rich membrane protein [Planctomycetaceae bacterium]